MTILTNTLVIILVVITFLAMIATVISMAAGPLLIGRALIVRSDRRRKNTDRPPVSFRIPILVCVVPISTLMACYGLLHLIGTFLP